MLRIFTRRTSDVWQLTLPNDYAISISVRDISGEQIPEGSQWNSHEVFHSFMVAVYNPKGFSIPIKEYDDEGAVLRTQYNFTSVQLLKILDQARMIRYDEEPKAIVIC